MNRNQQKKQTEQRVLVAAREAGAPIPTGELAGEEPDFRFLTPNCALGIEASEVLRPASTNFGISPVEAESFHQAIMLKAQEKYQLTNTAPTRVNVYFSPARGKKQDKRQLIDSLVDAVTRNRNRANPAVVLKGTELPEGFDHILITAESGEWWSGEGGGITLSEIRTEIADKIAAKNKLVSRYRANLPTGAQVSLGVQVEHLVVDGRGHVLERRWNAEAGADGEQVEGVEFGLHPGGEGVDVRQRTRVARKHDGVLANLLLRRIQPGLRETRHQNARAPIDEQFRRREPHAARAADNHHLFTLVPFHAYSP